MKKLFLAVPLVALLAAGCGGTVQSTSSDNANQSQQTQASPTPTGSDSGMMSSSSMDSMMGSMWQGTLMASNDSAKGNYMITVSGHTIYLRSSRDYSQLVGKAVNVSYSGTMDNFTLGDITAQ